jgi:hypothetical protein
MTRAAATDPTATRVFFISMLLGSGRSGERLTDSENTGAGMFENGRPIVSGLFAFAVRFM